MVIYEIEQGKISIYTNCTIENSTAMELAADYAKINKILELLKPEIHVLMLPANDVKKGDKTKCQY